MVLVPAGDFEFGEKKARVPLPAFYIDKTEVSNKAYAEFCNATGRPLPKGFPQDKPDYPVVNVTILDAHAFAKWAGKRLPSAKEWEKAARGDDGRAFPWGNENDPARANVEPSKIAAGGFPRRWRQPLRRAQHGRQRLGICRAASGSQRAGDGKLPNPSRPRRLAQTSRGIRSAVSPSASRLAQNVIWDSTTVPARWSSPNIGFRCAKDAHQ